MSIRDAIQLWKLARRRLHSEEDYRKFQAFQASLLLQHLERYSVKVDGKVVVDLGSGIGGYSSEFARRGARVISLDLITPSHRPIWPQVAMVGDALSVPLLGETVDLVFCASLIEHVSDPGRLLSEISRILVAKGLCYLSFPPFYSPRGGHEYAPFHYLGEFLALRLYPPGRRRLQWEDSPYKVKEKPRSFSESYGGWGLHRMTVSKARSLISASGLEILDISTRYLPVSLIRWPVLGEFFTWHAQFLLAKPQAATGKGSAPE